MAAHIQAFEGYVPQVEKGVFLASGASVVGHVVLGAYSNIWFGAVLRGDMAPIVIGAHCTIQDLACLHVRVGEGIEMGDHVAIGHQAGIHSARIGDGALIGNGALIMDGACIGAECVVAPGSLVRRGVVVPPRSYVRGRPGRVVGALKENEWTLGRRVAEQQGKLAARYIGEREQGSLDTSELPKFHLVEERGSRP